MISSQLTQRVVNLDEVVDPGEPDWRSSGLKVPSVIRITRVAVAHESILLGTIGEVDANRLECVYHTTRLESHSSKPTRASRYGKPPL